MSEDPPVDRPRFELRGGLITAVVQDVTDGTVLMVASVSPEAWDLTLATGWATFWSTSRQELWVKGATSGDRLRIVEIRLDCDGDAVLYRVRPEGRGACHTRNEQGQTRRSCFYRSLEPSGTWRNLEP